MYKNLSKEELIKEKETCEKIYEGFKSAGINLDLSRGKPSPVQLSFSHEMDLIFQTEADYLSKTGFDVRNYGLVTGVLELRELLAEVLEVRVSQVFPMGSASLAIMHNILNWMTFFGIDGQPPMVNGTRKFICPVPGYDRHFVQLKRFGFEMIPVEITEEGPDMDAVERLVESDESVKGMWCMPKFSNPSGAVYSDEVVKRLANLKPKAKDFRIFWDNAYSVHDMNEEHHVLNILEEAEKSGNPDIVFGFTSTSKITYPESGISAVFASEKNIAWVQEQSSYERLNYNTVNQLRHAKFLKDKATLKKHMAKHAKYLRPKFSLVLEKLEESLGDIEEADWSKPDGGYFISVNLPKDTAKRTGALCKEAGLILTEIGSPFPDGFDPHDSNVRLAPTFPELPSLSQAMDLFCVSAKLAYLEKLILER